MIQNLPECLKLMLITDSEQLKIPLRHAVESALQGGVTAVQLREPGMANRELWQLALDIRELTARHHALLIINDRVDIALAVGADGVHLGWRSIPPKEARSIGQNLIIGVSTHNLDEALNAQQQGADYIALSPVFPTPSKKGLVPALGLEKFAAIVDEMEIPVVGLGGINKANAAQVRQSGACGIAVIRAILLHEDPAAAARDLLGP